MARRRRKRRSRTAPGRGLVQAVAGSPRESRPRPVAQGGHAPRGVAFHRAAADAHRGRDLSLGEVREYRSTIASRCLGSLRSAAITADRSSCTSAPCSALGISGDGFSGCFATTARCRSTDRDRFEHRLPQVGQRALRVPQPLPAIMHRHERVRHDIFRCGYVPHQQHRQAHEPPVTQRVQFRDRRVRAPPRACRARRDERSGPDGITAAGVMVTSAGRAGGCDRTPSCAASGCALCEGNRQWWLSFLSVA